MLGDPGSPSTSRQPAHNLRFSLWRHFRRTAELSIDNPPFRSTISYSVQNEDYATRYLFRFEAEHLLARSGFTVEAVYADYDKSPYGAKYPGELIFVARK